MLAEVWVFLNGGDGVTEIASGGVLCAVVEDDGADVAHAGVVVRTVVEVFCEELCHLGDVLRRHVVVCWEAWRHCGPFDQAFEELLALLVPTPHDGHDTFRPHLLAVEAAFQHALPPEQLDCCVDSLAPEEEKNREKKRGAESCCGHTRPF